MPVAVPNADPEPVNAGFGHFSTFNSAPEPPRRLDIVDGIAHVVELCSPCVASMTGDAKLAVLEFVAECAALVPPWDELRTAPHSPAYTEEEVQLFQPGIALLWLLHELASCEQWLAQLDPAPLASLLKSTEVRHRRRQNNVGARLSTSLDQAPTMHVPTGLATGGSDRRANAPGTRGRTVLVEASLPHCGGPCPRPLAGAAVSVFCTLGSSCA